MSCVGVGRHSGARAMLPEDSSQLSAMEADLDKVLSLVSPTRRSYEARAAVCRELMKLLCEAQQGPEKGQAFSFGSFPLNT